MKMGSLIFGGLVLSRRKEFPEQLVFCPRPEGAEGPPGIHESCGTLVTPLQLASPKALAQCGKAFWRGANQ